MDRKEIEQKLWKLLDDFDGSNRESGEERAHTFSNTCVHGSLLDLITQAQQEARREVVEDIVLELEDYPPDSDKDWVLAMENIGQYIQDKYLKEKGKDNCFIIYR